MKDIKNESTAPVFFKDEKKSAEMNQIPDDVQKRINDFLESASIPMDVIKKYIYLEQEKKEKFDREERIINRVRKIFVKFMEKLSLKTVRPIKDEMIAEDIRKMNKSSDRFS